MGHFLADLGDGLGVEGLLGEGEDFGVFDGDVTGVEVLEHGQAGGQAFEIGGWEVAGLEPAAAQAILFRRQALCSL